MKLDEFLKITGNFAVIETESLLAGVSDPKPLKVQISRWCKSGKLIQVKRGIYLFSEAYRKKEVFEPYLAAVLKKPSYISLEKALEYHSMIPEAVASYTCVTTKRPGKFVSKAGVFTYRHMKRGLFWGYESVRVDSQTGFMAVPEKALLDLIYFRGMKITDAWLRELRLQNIEKINPDKLSDYAKRFKSPGMLKAAAMIRKYLYSYEEEEKVL
jgi:predicted transcriptional regulator of viral defense system